MKSLVMITCVFAMALTLHAQAIGNDTGYTTPDQTITGGLHFDQSASPQIQGDVAYAKHVSGAIYSYNAVRLTSISIQKVAGQALPKIETQSQTETGVCTYMTTVLGFAMSSCVSAGLAAAPGQSAGASASGTLVGLKSAKWKNVVWGFDAGPSYSAITSDKPTWFFGLRVGWGR